jgi:hypothetical protein
VDGVLAGLGLKGGYDAGVKLVSNVKLFTSPISATPAR